ncbi:MAG: hypothetical protein ACJ74Z_01500 [Bryobacteraceae bacterium]
MPSLEHRGSPLTHGPPAYQTVSTVFATHPTTVYLHPSQQQLHTAINPLDQVTIRSYGEASPGTEAPSRETAALRGGRYRRCALID